MKLSTEAKFEVISPNVNYTEDSIEVKYDYQTTTVETSSVNGKLLVTPKTHQIDIRTDRKVPKLGLMLVGWGGNNGSTLTAALEANRSKMEWRTKEGTQQANFYGSITQSSTVLIGSDENLKDIYLPMKDVIPMVDCDNIIVGGWDISSLNIGESMKRAKVLDINLQDMLYEKMSKLKPRPSIYDPTFIAANQSDRADNVISGTKYEQFLKIREDIKEFKKTNKVDKIVVLWTANTERFCEVRAGLNSTLEELEHSLKNNNSEVSPSTIFAMASISEACIFINGAPQNTFVPGVIEMAEKNNAFIAGDDFKSGQTKLKSVLVDFLVGAGIKPRSIVSYNHLGNNDGKNLSAPQQFRSKEISKSNVVDDMVDSNRILFNENEGPDHVVVIKYVPYVGDSKRAMDEYTSELMMGGHNTLVIHNTCEDSLLATPIILDLVILGELCSRIQIKDQKESPENFVQFKSVLSLLSYFLKAPLVPEGTQVVNSLFRQRAAIENILRACVGLTPISHMALEQRFDFASITNEPAAKKLKIAIGKGQQSNGSNGVHQEAVYANGKH